MRCPECSARELRVEVTLTGTMTCRIGPDEPLKILQTSAFDSSWNPLAVCACVACGWNGFVSEAAETEADLGKITPIRSSGCRVIEDELAANRFPSHLAPHIEHLLESVHRLNAQLEVLQSTQKQATPVSEVPSHNVAIF